MEPVQKTHLCRLAANPHPAPFDISQPPPRHLPNPTLEELRWFCVVTAPWLKLVSFDIENAGPHLVCVGFTALSPDNLEPADGVCFRFRRQGGDPWWEEPAHTEVVRLLYDLLANPDITKLGWFCIQHDVPFLEELGFTVAGRLLDLSVLLHAVHSELPKGLQKNATLFCGAPRWKDVPDEKEAEPAEEDAA